MQKTLEQHRPSVKDIKFIVVTHAHVDHVGSAACLRALSGAPIIGHQGDVQYYENKSHITYCATGLAGALFLKTRIPREPYTAFTPDILLSDDAAFDLGQYGLPGVLKHSPGHTAGSITLELPTLTALIGDLVASGILIGGIARRGRAIRPPFEDDPHAVAGELIQLLDASFERFHMGHGGHLHAQDIRRHALALAKAKRYTRPRT